MEQHLNTLLAAREPGTGLWLLENQDVRKWIDGCSDDMRRLWLRGYEGAGKSILAATLAEEMRLRARQTMGNTRPDALCFYACRNEAVGSTGEAVISSLVLQLATQSQRASQLLELGADNDLIANTKAPSTLQELGALLDTTVTHFRRVSVFIVDVQGLETDVQRSVLSLLVDLSHAYESAVRLCISGSVLDDVYKEICHKAAFHTLLAMGKSEDIRLYIRSQLSRKKAFGMTFLDSESVPSGLESRIVGQSHGA